ncbi:MAG TPA: biotin/lipoyl-containing protein [Candidatus Limnocylindria bacterium]|nr:biotin/lipoyl-containing protein [Candidatus Limnocylindria bacterium]
MTDTDRALDAVRAAADDLVAQLGERLERHGLTEIEVAHGDFRLRVSASGGSRPPEPADPPAAIAAPSGPHASDPPPGDDATPTTVGVGAPAVGYFIYADGLGPGLPVTKGDVIGHVEMLGVRHDVRAPRSGTVRHLVAESGEAVEYGQVVVEIEPAPGASR